MNKRRPTNEDILENVYNSLNSLNEIRTSELEKIKTLLQIKNSALEQERTRLKKKYGANHPRVKKIDERISYNQGLFKYLDVEIDRSKIKIQPFDLDSWRIHGRVLDENRKGIKGLTVSLYDEKEKVINHTTTDKLGYYSITLSLKEEGHMKTIENQNLLLKVKDKENRTLAKLGELLIVTKGYIDYREIVIAEEDENTPNPEFDEDTQPENNKDSTVSSDLWIVSGKIVDNKNKGISGLIVSLYDKDLFFDDKLGTTITGDDGYFKFIYRTEAFRDLFEKKPDLYIKVLDRNGKVLFSSKKNIRYEAGHRENIDIRIKKK